MAWRSVMVLTLVACGRHGFDALPGDATSDADDMPANYAFVTSTRHPPTTFGSDFSGADAICNMRADEAGLPGTYVAWLSTTAVDAVDRLAGARGWIRTDGKPFADRVEDLVGGRIYYPLIKDEHGTEVRDFVLTGTNEFGRLLPSNCNDYSNSGLTIYFGVAVATAHGWTHESTIGCATPGRIYCFGTDVSKPVAVVPASGRTAFLTSGNFIPDPAGLASADALCSSEAGLAGRSGMYRALLATTTATAISRVPLDGATWVRTDGVALADSPLALAMGVMEAPLNVTAAQAYAVANAYTGATSVTELAGSAADDCGDWTNPNGTARLGLPSYVDSNFFYYSSNNTSCSGLPIYCLEQ